MKSITFSQALPRIIIILSAIIAVSLAVAAWDINFWPTDAKVYYFDATIEVPHIKHLSEIHASMDQDGIRWLHGKEILILSISIMQRLMNDFDTLRPFLMVFIIAHALSSVLIFFLTRKLWDDLTACVCYGAFVTSMWPYLYILFCKHQPLGLMFALAAVLLLLCADRARVAIWIYVSGLLLGLSLFSSPVSSLYLPFYVAAFFYLQKGLYVPGSSLWSRTWRFLGHGSLAVLGFVTVFVYVNWPDVWQNFQGYVDYVNISSHYSHFFYNQPFLQQWFLFSDIGAERIRGGWEWVFKYFFVVMPVLFPAALLAAAGLIVKAASSRSGRAVLVALVAVLLGLAPSIMAETAGVAQYGGNFFPSIIGFVFLLGFIVHAVRSAGFWQSLSLTARRVCLLLAVVICLLQVSVNAVLFFGDVFPTRMATTYLSRTIKALKEKTPDKKIYTYLTHPHRNHFIMFLDPEVMSQVRFVPIKYIIQPQDGYLLIPPASGDSIYIAAISDYADYDEDVFFSELRRRGNLADYAVASFRTLANSRIWLHEEEILSYRALILGHAIPADEDAGRLWLLNGKKIYEDLRKNIPGRDYQRLLNEDLRYIGTKSKVFRYRGYTGRLQRNRVLNELYVRVRKVGNPQDSLLAYVYKVDEEQTLWVPFSAEFRSRPLPAAQVPNNLDEPAKILFDPPLQMGTGKYYFHIYRTGPEDDNNYYEVYTKKLGMF